MLKKIFIACLVFTITNNVFAQIQWPALTQQTKPWTRWWWQGSGVDKPNLTWAMQQYQQAGLGGLEITPIYGVKGARVSSLIFYLRNGWRCLSTHWVKRRN
jgi:hypothetical protein